MVTVTSPLTKMKKEDVNWWDRDSKVSKYFTIKEVTQNDQKRTPTTDEIKNNVLELAAELDKVREKWGKPIGVTSWYRPAAINKAVGGASRSAHIKGTAADIYPIGGNVWEFQKWLDVFWGDKALGYGAKKGFVHVDLRRGRLRWNY